MPACRNLSHKLKIRQLLYEKRINRTGEFMQAETVVIPMAKCETCGHQYDGRDARCPRCDSNQRVIRHLDGAFSSCSDQRAL